jgi:hypothetical protein
VGVVLTVEADSHTESLHGAGLSLEDLVERNDLTGGTFDLAEAGQEVPMKE